MRAQTETISWIMLVECHTHAHTQILSAERSDWSAKILALAHGELTRPL